MTRRDPPMTAEERRRLETLYQQHGEAEPEPGLDRIVRARAEQAAREGTGRRPAHWIGGIATAAVVVLAIGVVIHQMPPEQLQEPVPSSEDRAKTEVEMPSRPAAPRPDAQLRERRLEQPRRVPPAQEEAAGMDRIAPSSADSERARETPPASLALPAPRYPLADLDDLAVRENPTPQAALLHIQALIDIGEIEQARELLQAVRELYPEMEIPQAIIEVLEPKVGE